MVAAIIWLVCIASAMIAAVLRDANITTLLPYAFVGSLPAFLSLALYPVLRQEWAQILIIIGWLSLAILACLSIAFVPMAILFLCAPAAAALFEKEKVIEAMFLSAIFAALLYYASEQGFGGLNAIASDYQSDWGQKAGIASTIAFLVAAMFGAASSRTKVVQNNVLDYSLFDNVPGAVFRVGPSNTMTYANPSAKSMFGLSSRRDRLSTDDLFYWQDEKDFVNLMITSTRETGDSLQEKFSLKNGNHAKRVTITTSKAKDGDIFLHFLDNTKDDTRILDLETANQLALQDTQDKSLFFAGVSHELRTPLNAIIGFSDMMRSRLFGPLPGKYAEYADLIHDSGQHMLDLIGDVLDMSKIDAGKYELLYSSFDAVDVIRSSIKMMQPMADSAEVQLGIEIGDEHQELMMEADRKALRQILLNLISNAVKFSNKGDRVVVRTQIVGDVLNITVRDNGVGMSSEELKDVGKPYAQTESGKTSQARGTGLGLTLVKSLAELHEGRFAIASQKGQGTSADIYLPMTRNV